MAASLGEGGFGVVRAALNTETGDVVAIKVLNKEKWDSYWKADLRAFLRREIFAMKTVSHPNIVQLLDVLASKERVFLVMELVFGGTLKEELEDEGALPEATARKYFQQMMTAVEFCHEKGVFHRDLKPENVLLDTRDGCIKVADFGLSAITYQTDITGAPRSVLRMVEHLGTRPPKSKVREPTPETKLTCSLVELPCTIYLQTPVPSIVPRPPVVV